MAEGVSRLAARRLPHRIQSITHASKKTKRRVDSSLDAMTGKPVRIGARPIELARAPLFSTGDCLEAIQHNPKDTQSYFLLATIEDQEGDWQKAKELYQKALQLQRDSAQTSNNLALLMLEHGGNSDVAPSLAQTTHQEPQHQS